MSTSNQTGVLVYAAYLNSLATTITYYSLWIIMPVAVLGNLVSLYIYTRPNLNKKTNTGFLYSWLCVINVVMILFYTFVYRSQTLMGYTVLATPCGLSSFLRRTALNSISWLQVIICMDRFVAVYFPNRSAWFSKKKFLYGIMLVFLAFILITNVTNLLTYPVTTTKDNVTTTSCTSSVSISIATDFIADLMRIFIPFGVMITFNLIVMWRLKHSKIKVGVANVTRIGPNAKGLRMFTSKEYKFTVATIIIDFVFLFFYFPIGIYYVEAIYSSFNNSVSADPLSSAAWNLFSNLSQLMAIAHTDALLFVFVIFNRYFRDELIDLLHLRRLFPRKSDVNANISMQASRTV